MAKRLQIKLFPNWKEVEAKRDEYPFRFVRETDDHYSVLDITFAEYSGGKIPNPSCDGLVGLAKNADASLELISSKYDNCGFGQYGTAIFRSDKFQFIQRWFLSNGKDFIIAEYFNYLYPEDIELQELQQIIHSLDLDDESKRIPKWKFW